MFVEDLLQYHDLITSKLSTIKKILPIVINRFRGSFLVMLSIGLKETAVAIGLSQYSFVGTCITSPSNT